MVDAAVVFRQPVAFVAARGEVVLAFVGADGEFLFAAVEGDVAPARYGEDVRELAPPGVMRVLPLLVLLVSSAPGMRKP